MGRSFSANRRNFFPAEKELMDFSCVHEVHFCDPGLVMNGFILWITIVGLMEFLIKIARYSPRN